MNVGYTVHKKIIRTIVENQNVVKEKLTIQKIKILRIFRESYTKKNKALSVATNIVENEIEKINSKIDVIDEYIIGDNNSIITVLIIPKISNIC